MGNKEKYFEFTVQLTGEEGKTLSLIHISEPTRP